MAWIRRYPIPAVYLVLSLVPLVYVAAVYEGVRTHAAGWGGLLLVAALTIAVVPLRRRWAWWIAVVVHALAILSSVYELEHWLGLLISVVLLALLLSPQMREFIASTQPVREGDHHV